MAKVRHVIFFSVSRSDYFYLRNLIREFCKCSNIKSTLFIVGNHLLKKFGFTYDDIQKDKHQNLNIKKIKLKAEKDTLKISAKILTNLNKTLKNYNNKETLSLILGDRFEAFAIAQALLNFNIKLCHIAGGSVTLGSHDNNYRNFLSGMASIHIVETKLHKKNLIENNIKKNIIVSGPLSLEHVKKSKFLDKCNLLKKHNINTNFKNIILGSFHPETTLDRKKNISNLKILLDSLDKKNCTIFTYPNFDFGYSEIIKILQKYQKSNKNFYIKKNLGHDYFNFLKISDILLGNSSSGIIESGFFNIPTINIGNRQQGRFYDKNVYHCKFIKDKISYLQKKILSKKKNKKNKIYNLYQPKITSKKLTKLILSKFC